MNIFPGGEECQGAAGFGGGLVTVVHIQGSQGKIRGRGQQGLPIPWKDTRLVFWPLDSAMEQKGPVSGPPRSLRSQWLTDLHPGKSPQCPLQARPVVLDTVLSPPQHTVSR